MSRRPPIDVTEVDWEIVQAILRAHVPELPVWAFGSRARRTAKPFSDLDLVIVSDRPLALGQRAALADAFAQSNLPWKVDAVDWATTSQAFRQRIEQDKVLVHAPALAGRALTA